MIVSVNPDILERPDVLARYAKRGRDYHGAMRFTLEVLGIDLPEALLRKPAGRPRGSATPCRMTLWRHRKRAEVQPAHSPA